MAHEIESTDTALYVKKAAWHGLGTVVPETLGAREGMRLIGLDWDVVQQPLWVEGSKTTDQGMFLKVDSHIAQVRSDTKEILGVVSAGFQTVQNSTLADIADALDGTGQCKVESMGSMRNGKRVWILARGTSFDVGRGDSHYPYVCLANGHDGSLSLRVLPTTVRVVCANTLAMALGNNTSGFTLRHTANVALRIEDVRQAMQQFAQHTDAARERAQRLSTIDLTRDQIQELWLSAIQLTDGAIEMNPTDAKGERRKAKAIEAIAHMSETFDREAKDFGANAYVAANAATQWIQHERGRLTGDARAASNLFGHYAAASQMVVRKAQQLIEG